MNGGKIQIIPGWNSGHPTAFFYVNMGYGTNPVNQSNPMVGVFQITGPSRDAYPGSFCLQQVPLPVNATELGLRPGDNATIQVIQVALHGASLYNVRTVLRGFNLLGRQCGANFYLTHSVRILPLSKRRKKRTRWKTGARTRQQLVSTKCSVPAARVPG